jgi:hypothetical protein
MIDDLLGLVEVTSTTGEALYDAVQGKKRIFFVIHFLICYASG